MNLSILGPQGSGKGTQAQKLVEKYKLEYFETGKYLRDLAKTRPDIDAVINKRGALLPDEQIFELVKQYLKAKNSFNNILFDGYPRSIKQYQLIEEFLTSKNAKLDKVIFLSIPDQEAIRRLSSRRIDKSTGEIYNLITNPPPQTINQLNLEQRSDDQPEAIAQRLAAYHLTTQPLIEYLIAENKVIQIDGTKSIEEVFGDICQKLA